MTWDRFSIKEVIRAGYTRLRVTCNVCGRRETVEIGRIARALDLEKDGWLTLDRLPFRCTTGHAPPKDRRWSPPFDVVPERNQVRRSPPPKAPVRSARVTVHQLVCKEVLGYEPLPTADPMPWLGYKGLFWRIYAHHIQRLRDMGYEFDREGRVSRSGGPS